LKQCLIVYGHLRAQEGLCHPSEMTQKLEICYLHVEETDNLKVPIEFINGLVRCG
jgi:hypothetical protein